MVFVLQAIHGHDSICSLLLEHGADVTSVDDSGFTPVQVAKTKIVRGTQKHVHSVVVW